MVTAVNKRQAKDCGQSSRRILLTDTESDFRFGVDSSELNPASNGSECLDYECMHDVEFIVMNSSSRAQAVKKLERFIKLLAKAGFDVSEEE